MEVMLALEPVAEAFLEDYRHGRRVLLIAVLTIIFIFAIIL